MLSRIAGRALRLSETDAISTRFTDNDPFIKAHLSPLLQYSKRKTSIHDLLKLWGSNYGTPEMHFAMMQRMNVFYNAGVPLHSRKLANSILCSSMLAGLEDEAIGLIRESHKFLSHGPSQHLVELALMSQTSAANALKILQLARGNHYIPVSARCHDFVLQMLLDENMLEKGYDVFADAKQLGLTLSTSTLLRTASDLLKESGKEPSKADLLIKLAVDVWKSVYSGICSFKNSESHGTLSRLQGEAAWLLLALGLHQGHTARILSRLDSVPKSAVKAMFGRYISPAAVGKTLEEFLAQYSGSSLNVS